MKKVPYASAVGSIMYAVRCTRPDVAFAQNLVSRYQQNPGKLHWVVVKHILKYLRNTKDMFLVCRGNPDTELEVTGLCDASWQCDKDDTKSQMGYVFVVNGGAVDWKSKKQTTIAMHATQSEYMAASEAAMKAVWIRKFVDDLGVESGEIKLIKVHTDKNIADAFIKALPRGKIVEGWKCAIVARLSNLHDRRHHINYSEPNLLRYNSNGADKDRQLLSQSTHRDNVNIHLDASDEH
nr:hypothetical protein [Tanacetum cinerariifolium]